jgi:hypothetical protein
MQTKQRMLSLNSTAQNLVYRETVHSVNTLVVQNISQTGFAYIGTIDVSSSSFGFKLFPGQSFTVELAYSDNIYAVGDSGVQVSILEIDRG